MQLALKSSDAIGANLLHKASSAIIKARLVSMYSHAGVAINGNLYHVTSERGLHCLTVGQWNPERWDIFDTACNDDFALQKFEELKGAKYDWLGLLAFVGARFYSFEKLYCFEWCWVAMGQPNTKLRITPELLLVAENRIRGKK